MWYKDHKNIDNVIITTYRNGVILLFHAQQFSGMLINNECGVVAQLLIIDNKAVVVGTRRCKLENRSFYNHFVSLYIYTLKDHLFQQFFKGILLLPGKIILIIIKTRTY